MSFRKNLFYFLLFCLFFLGFKTYWDLKPVVDLFHHVTHHSQSLRVLDRYGTPLMISYQGQWNDHDRLSLSQVPPFLIQALILSEDQHFYTHKGIDWKAKGKALYQNLRARRMIRGASTISEQTARLLTGRSRTLWSKWLGMIEALLLDHSVSKKEILEFYLNQVPFASHRRGLNQAALSYFNRDLSTLTQKEMLCLVLLIRAPSSYDLKKSTTHIEKYLPSLIRKMKKENYLSSDEEKRIQKQPLLLESPSLSIQAPHFLRYLKQTYSLSSQQPIISTLDGPLQHHIQELLKERLKNLSSRHVSQGAVLILNHQTGEIVTWITEGSQIDGVLAHRQPGSVLKPFLYALALDQGWTASTLIMDEPLVGPVGSGLHRFRNYSNLHYGPVTVREALANSLNIPAIKTIQYVGVTKCLQTFRSLGLSSLNRDEAIYDEGLALGNGEISLFDLVKAYTVFLKGAPLSTLHVLKESSLQNPSPLTSTPIFSPATTSLIHDILSDPWARRWEFGLSSILHFPVQTAVKTGTSTDYRDAWIIGYNHRYIVGIWMGNLDNTPMDGITGAVGPALLLRSIYGLLNQHTPTKSLPMSPDLIQKSICLKRPNQEKCVWQREWVKKESQDLNGDLSVNRSNNISENLTSIRYKKPTPGLKMALDPRIPSTHQKFQFELSDLGEGDRAQWMLNNKKIGESTTPHFLWSLEAGTHELYVIVYKGEQVIHTLPLIRFVVKEG